MRASTIRTKNTTLDTRYFARTRFGRGFDRPEPGRVLEHRQEEPDTQPYGRWEPKDYVFHSGIGYHREFIEPYKAKGYSRSDSRIEEDVNQRLTDHAELDATEIRVRVDDGEVTLEGSISKPSFQTAR